MKLASDMAPAAHFVHMASAIQGLITAKGVGLEIALIAMQMRLRMQALAICAEAIEHGGCVQAARIAIIAQDVDAALSLVLGICTISRRGI